MNDFTAFYQRTNEATGLRTQVELAEFLGIRQSSISDAKRRNSVPAEWLVTLLIKKSLNPSWLLTGEGPAYVTGADGAPLVQDGADGISQLNPNYKTTEQAQACVCGQLAPHGPLCVADGCMCWIWTGSDRAVGYCNPDARR